MDTDARQHSLYSKYRVMVLGASGLLGKYLVRSWPESDYLLGFNSRDVDIRSAERVRSLVQEHQPDWIVLAAAYTDVDGCETNSELAMQVNFQGAVNVAKAAQESASQLLFISSDYVFDGCKTTPYEVDDRINPQNVYGRSKAEAERGIQEILPGTCIVRTSWVFGTGGKCFPDTILKLARERTQISVVDDQRGCPTYARDLAKAIVQLCHARAEGIVHVTNTGDCTWFSFAQEIVRQSRLPISILATTTDRFSRPAKRPSYSVLSSRSLKQYRIMMPAWQHGLTAYLAEGS